MVVITDSSWEYPTSALLPRKETGVHNFLAKYPEYDGRGTVIAILDSGVDPAAGGLQVTTEGKPKVIERFDCTGSGDVDMTKKVEAVNSEIKGLTGRMLKVPSHWKNPTGVYRIGIKIKYELMNKSKIDNWHKESKEKYIEAHKAAVAASTEKLQKFNEGKENEVLTSIEELEKSNIEAEIEVLNSLLKKYQTISPVYDCVLFHDGNKWCAVVDTTEKGNLDDCNLLVEYSEDPTSYAVLSSKDQITYSINVHNDGDILEIVSCSSAHGTHVASIAAAYFPECPERNGVAPGAQIISLCIGDGRLNGMETGTGLIRAMIRIMQNCRNGKPVHVINMSYGEMANWSNTGRIGEFVNKVIDNYGVVWVASAANKGPALFTIGAPPDMSTTNIIGVGAYASPELSSVEFAHPVKPSATAYTWSSRGPTMDGDRGVTIIAPGGAVTSVPLFTLRSCQYLNGTSMSSPHVTGAVALLISGLLKNGVKFTPYLIKRTLENTALYIDTIDCFAQGHGLLQVEKAFEYLMSYHKEKESVVRFKITAPNGRKGILHYADEVKEYETTVEPKFFDEDNADPVVKINFRLSLVLISDAPWVETTKYLEMFNSKRSLVVKVDPTTLTEGAHRAVIKAFDVNKPEKGSVFNIDIAAFKTSAPISCCKKFEFSRQDVLMTSTSVKRHFFNVPETCSYAVAYFESPNINKTGKFVLHTMQVLPMKSCRSLCFHKVFKVVDGKCGSLVYFKAQPGYVLEFAVAKSWTSPADMTLNYTIRFGTTSLLHSQLVMHHGQGIYQMDIKSTARFEPLSPNIQLKQSTCYLKPTESTISVLTDQRDVIPPNISIYQLILVYTFNIAKLTDVIVSNPLLSDLLYESDYESQIWMLFDCNKRHITTGDAFPEKYSCKLDKGHYVIRHQIRHDNKEMLEKLTDLSIMLDQKLTSPITLDVYFTQSNAMLGIKSEVIPQLHPNIIPLYVAPLPVDKLPKIAISPGQHLTGVFTFLRDDLSKKVDQYDFKYILTDISKKSNGTAAIKATNKIDDYEDAYRDLLKQWLQKLNSANKNVDVVYGFLMDKYSDQPSIYTLRIQSVEPDNKRHLPGVEISSLNEETLRNIISLADEALNLINGEEILKFMGTKTDNETDRTSKTKSVMEQNKTTLIEALARKGCSMCKLHILQQGDYVKSKSSVKSTTKKEDEVEEVISLSDIDSIWVKMLKYTDPTDTKSTLYFGAWYAVVHHFYGTVAKTLLKLAEEKPTFEVDISLLWTFKKLKWRFLRDYYINRLIVHYPNNYSRF